MFLVNLFHKSPESNFVAEHLLPAPLGREQPLWSHKLCPRVLHCQSDQDGHRRRPLGRALCARALGARRRRAATMAGPTREVCAHASQSGATGGSTASGLRRGSRGRVAAGAAGKTARARKGERSAAATARRLRQGRDGVGEERVASVGQEEGAGGGSARQVQHGAHLVPRGQQDRRARRGLRPLAVRALRPGRRHTPASTLHGLPGRLLLLPCAPGGALAVAQAHLLRDSRGE